ncbi:MAG: myxococcus cysteine-rich repeat containing protein, partial [Myxococcota bacterium]
WYTVTVDQQSSLRVSLLGSTSCPPGFTIELWRGGIRLDQVSSVGNRCPSIFRGRLSGPYFIRVFGDRNMVVSPYILGIAVLPPRCGDGIQNQNEQCDDGNLVSGDGCDAFCFAEPEFLYERDFQVIPWTEPNRQAIELPWLPYNESQDESSADEGFWMVPLPFEFPYFGRSHHGVVVHTNGFISLHPDLSSSPEVDALIGPMRPNAIIAPLGIDLEWNAGRAVKVWTGVDPQFGEIAWFDFSEARIKNVPGSAAEARVGITSRGFVLFRYGEIETNAAFVSAMEDHTGLRVLPVCQVGCDDRTSLSNTVTVFGNTLP